MTAKEQEEIFNDWLKQFRLLVFKIVRAYAWTIMDRDDLFQEITLQLWHSIPRFRKESAPVTWIYRVALNTSIRWVKKERRHYDVKEKAEPAPFVLQETRTEEDERLTWLYQEIYRLDEIDRSLTLLMLDGFSYKEMAAILGITESHVGVKINRIKKLLTEKSKKYDDHGI